MPRGAPPAPAGAGLEVEVRPPWPYRLPRGGGGDAVMRVRRGIVTRLLHVDGAAGRGPGLATARRERGLPFASLRRAGSARSSRSSGCDSRSESTTTTVRALRRVSGRSAARDGDSETSLAPAAAPPLGLGGARLVDHQAADRIVAGGRDPAADGVSLGSPVRGPGRRDAARRSHPGADRRPRPGRARGNGPGAGPGAGADPGRPRGGRGPRRPWPTRPATGACWRSARSVPGPSSAWASTAAASPTRCPPATSGSSSWWAGWRASAAAPPSRRWRSSSPPTPRTAALPARSCWPPTTRRSPRARRFASQPEPRATPP